MSVALRVRDLKKTFKSDFMIRKIIALDGVSFEVNEGDLLGFVGHNGAGKTTTIKILTNLIKATAGDVEILGHKLGDPELPGKIGFLPERPYFYEYLTARESLLFYGRLNNMARSDIIRKSEELLELMGMADAADRKMRTYSKGMLQRFGIIQALVHDPPFVILDEPMSGLDPIGRGQVREILLMLKDSGKTVMFSTHILSDIEQICDKVVLIGRGRNLYTGGVDELLKSRQDGVEFALSDLDGDQVSYLSSLPGTLRGASPSLVLEISKDVDERQILRDLVEHNIHIERVSPKQSSLEEIFVQEFRQTEDMESEAGSDHH